MTAPELDTLTQRGKLGILTMPEQMLLAAAFDEYRQHALTLERAVHDMSKQLDALDLEAEDIDNQINQRLKCEASLRRIIAMAGAPDAADACRSIIKEASECLDHKAGD